jgi:hypothetical protein
MSACDLKRDKTLDLFLLGPEKFKEFIIRNIQKSVMNATVSSLPLLMLSVLFISKS